MTEEMVKTIGLTITAIIMLGLCFVSGYGMGRDNLIKDMGSYGCEKVIGVIIK